MNRYRAQLLFLGATILLVSTAAGSQQPPTQWTPDQIAEAVSVVRAGRGLTPVEWPNGARVAVCLSFDVDNETLTLNGGNTSPVALSAGEFGAVSGLPRVLALLDRHEIPASFFIPAARSLSGIDWGWVATEVGEEPDGT